MKQRVLITGASGFVGACLARHRLERGDELHVVVRPTSHLWRLEELRGRMKVHCADLLDADAVRRVVEEAEPQTVFHCATFGGFADQQDPKSVVGTNLHGTMNIVEALENTGATLINTGSSSEYGHKPAPMGEDDVLEPLTLYGVAKAAATLYCQAVARSEGMPIVTLRLFSPYGPWDDPRRLIPTVIARCLRGQPLELTAGTQARDFVAMEDVCAAYDAAAQMKCPRGEIVNVGSGVQHTVREVVEALARLCGYRGEPTWGVKAAVQPETRCWVADIRRARERLGWEPRTEFEHGLSRTVDWFHRNLNHYD